MRRNGGLVRLSPIPSVQAPFLMMPYVTWKKGHVAVALIFDILPKPAVRPAVWFTYLLGTLACALATWITGGETLRQWVNDVHIMAVEPVPKYLISWVIPLVLPALHSISCVCSTGVKLILQRRVPLVDLEKADNGLGSNAHHDAIIANGSLPDRCAFIRSVSCN